MSLAIDVQGVSKRFRLYQEKYTSLKERVLHGGKIPFEEFWALDDVSAEIRQGETIGILGRNGSGKSTLLKCIAGILQPTKGQIVLRGQLASMLELGAGFQGELSGRDNIYLNASLLGFSRREIDRRFDDIVGFAELEQFIDNQVRFYSSGMYVRLGFAVAVNVDPDILMIDEVLAVGDERFQHKCLERIKQFQNDGRTIVVVSHSADTLAAICQRVMVLDGGRIVTVANPGEAILAFRERLEEYGATLDAASGEGGIAPIDIRATAAVRLLPATFEHPGLGDRPYLLPGEPLEVRAAYQASEPLEGVVFGLSLVSAAGELLFDCDSEALGEIYSLQAGEGTVTFSFDGIPLLDGTYAIHLRIQDAGGGMVYDRAAPAGTFQVMNPGRSMGLVALPLTIKLSPGSAA